MTEAGVHHLAAITEEATLESLKFHLTSLLLLHSVINNKMYGTSHRQLPSYCAFKCDNKQTSTSTLKAEEEEEKLTN